MIDILMATYNGEKYISQQIDSILNQSCKDWRLFVSDDCSTDGTAAILEKYQSTYPHKIFVTYRSSNSGSAAENFFSLLSKSKADFILTADQDDVWKRDKVEKTLAALRSVPPHVPALVHTDLTVVDHDLHIVSESMTSLQHIPTDNTSINRLVVQNIVTGCTMGINRSLADIVKTPVGIPVHDWWLACTAALFGKIIYLPESTIMYRQHGSNACGAQNMDSTGYILDRLRGRERSKYMLRLGYVMAEQLVKNYNVTGKKGEMLQAYADLQNEGWLKKLRVVCKYNIWKSGFVRKAGQLLFM